MTAAADFRTSLDHVLGSGTARVVVDLAEVTFIGGLKKARQALVGPPRLA